MTIWLVILSQGDVVNYPSTKVLVLCNDIVPINPSVSVFNDIKLEFEIK